MLRCCPEYDVIDDVVGLSELISEFCVISDNYNEKCKFDTNQAVIILHNKIYSDVTCC